MNMLAARYMANTNIRSIVTSCINFAPEEDDPLDSRPSHRYHTYSETYLLCIIINDDDDDY